MVWIARSGDTTTVTALVEPDEYIEVTGPSSELEMLLEFVESGGHLPNLPLPPSIMFDGDFDLDDLPDFEAFGGFEPGKIPPIEGFLDIEGFPEIEGIEDLDELLERFEGFEGFGPDSRDFDFENFEGLEDFFASGFDGPFGPLDHDGCFSISIDDGDTDSFHLELPPGCSTGD